MSTAPPRAKAPPLTATNECLATATALPRAMAPPLTVTSECLATATALPRAMAPPLTVTNVPLATALLQARALPLTVTNVLEKQAPPNPATESPPVQVPRVLPQPSVEGPPWWELCPSRRECRNRWYCQARECVRSTRQSFRRRREVECLVMHQMRRAAAPRQKSSQDAAPRRHQVAREKYPCRWGSECARLHWESSFRQR